MRHTLRTFEDFWTAAPETRPLVILGAGRVWAVVAADARGAGQEIALLARNNFAETLAWRDGVGRSGITVFCDPTAAVASVEDGASALIASRPGDHGRDLQVCLDAGLPALVEKPFTADPVEGEDLVRRAASAGVAVGIGIEFSLLPELHALAERLGDWTGNALLRWEDPAAEARHGAVKRAHGEVGVLDDILPHALSVFGVINPGAGGWQLQAARESGQQSGRIDLLSGSRSYTLLTSKTARERVRHLQIHGDRGEAKLDFSRAPAVLTIDGEPVALDPAWTRLDSTLRLELGAWFRALDGDRPAIVASLPLYLAMHARLRELLD